MGMSKEEIITRWKDFESSPYRHNMKDGYRYFSGHNDIEKRSQKVFFPDLQNEVQEKESHYLANNKLSHNFLGKLVNQKVSYGLAKQFSIDNVDPDNKKKFADYRKELSKNYFTRKFFAQLKTVGADSRVAGRGIFYYFYENNNLNFVRFDPTECCLVWEDELLQNDLKALIRKYQKVEFIDGNKIIVRYMYCYEKDGITKLRNVDVNQESQIDGWETAPQTSWGEVTKNGKRENIFFNKLPFIIFKNGFEMKQDLDAIKSLIDDYDLICSENSNDVCNISSSTKVVRGYSGDSKEEFVRNMAFYNTVFLDEDGGMEVLTSPLVIDQVDIHLQRLRKDIFEFGNGVDTVNRELRDVSGIALRELYADLDNEFNNWSCFLSEALEETIAVMTEDIKRKTGIDYSDVEYNIIYNTDMVINEKEIAEIAQLYKGILSPETLASNASWTKNAEKEVMGVREQMEFENELSKQVTEEKSEQTDKTKTNNKTNSDQAQNDFNKSEKAGAK